MHNIASRLTDYLIAHNITTLEMREKHIYGFEVLFGKVLNYGTLFLLACINHNLIPTLFFMSTFFGLRGRTGGYHAKTALKCYVGTLIIFFLVTKIITPFISTNTYTLIGVVGISGIMIFLFSPINHPNLELDEEEIKSCRNYSRLSVILISLCVLITVWLDIIPVCRAYVVAGMGMDAGLLLLAKIVRQEVSKE